MLFFLRNISDLPFPMIVALLGGMVLALLFGMTVHEWAHNYVGHLMGDPNPKRLGKLTLNPMKHIYWQGFLMFVLIGFGILGTAPISAHRMRNPRTGYLYAVAAGPLSNLLVAVVFGIIYRLIMGIGGVPTTLVDQLGGGSAGYIYGLALTPEYLGGQYTFAIFLAIIASQIAFWNLLLFVFNFLPFFPLDGWHIALALLPAREAIWWERNAQMSMFIFFALLLFGFATPFDPLGILVTQPVNFLTGIVMG